ncbi:MAG TPA: hypothetical protein VF290_27205 [Pyrinomonadaceae bacterium]
MYRKLCTTLLIVFVTLGPVHAQAQQDSSAAQAKKIEEQALRQKAFELLESLAGELGTLQSAENRARIGSNIAWSLWPHNENRARALFTQVQSDLNLVLQAPQSKPQDVNTFMVFLKLRADTTERIAKHDPELAYEFFKATALSANKKFSHHLLENERRLETHIAKQLSSSNPNLSLEIGRKLLSQGFSDDLRLLLGRLHRKHKAQATVLYKEIVQKLSGVDLVEDWSARTLALNIANTLGPPAGDEASFREIVNMFVKALAQNACATNLDDEEERASSCRTLAPSILLIAKVDPSRASKFQRWLEQASHYYLPPQPYDELQQLSNDGSVDDILALIEQYPRMEFDIRFRAAQKAQEDGDPERARKIAAEYTADPEGQRRLLTGLERTQITPITSAELEEAQKRLGELHGSFAQVVFLLTAADRVADTDRKGFLKLLNQATEIVDAMKPGKDQAGLQIHLAVVYSYEKNSRGLAIMESLMPKLNELVGSAAKLDGFDIHYLRDGEWNMTGEGELGQLLTGLAQHAGYFAWCDFDRAVSVAGQFERPEIRMMAQLKLAQGILAGPPKRLDLDRAGSQY